jgi:ATP-dependent DNA helicase RecQ
MNFCDVNLGYFEFIQKKIKLLIAGENLIPNEQGCLNSKGELVLKFSKAFLTNMAKLKAEEFSLKSAKVNIILYWTDHENEMEFLVVLPELSFERNVK